MKKFIILIQIFNACFSCGSDISINILFNTNDCINCTIALNQLDKVDKSIEKNIIVKEDDKKYISEYLSQYGLSKSSYRLIVSDKKYNAFKIGDKSTVYIFYNNKEVSSFYLKDLSKNISSLNSFNKSYSVTKKIASLDSLTTLTNRLQFFSSDKKFLMLDYLLNKIVIVENNQEGKINYKIISPKSFDLKPFFSIAKFDPEPFYNILPILQAFNKDKIRFESAYFNKDTLYLFGTLTYPKFQGDDTLLSNNYFLIKNYDSTFNGYYINDSIFMSQTGYQIDNTNPFQVIGEKVLLNIFKNELGNSNKIFSSWTIHDENLLFDSLLSYELPEYFVKKNDIYSNSTFGINGDLFFFNSYPELINLKSATTYNLEAALVKNHSSNFLSSFYLLDSFQNDETIFLLYVLKKGKSFKIFISFYDVRKAKIILTRQVGISPKQEELLNFKLLRSGSILFVNKGKEIIEIQ